MISGEKRTGSTYYSEVVIQNGKWKILCVVP